MQSYLYPYTQLIVPVATFNQTELELHQQAITAKINSLLLEADNPQSPDARNKYLRQIDVLKSRESIVSKHLSEKTYSPNIGKYDFEPAIYANVRLIFPLLDSVKDLTGEQLYASLQTIRSVIEQLDALRGDGTSSQQVELLKSDLESRKEIILYHYCEKSYHEFYSFYVSPGYDQAYHDFYKVSASPKSLEYREAFTTLMMDSENRVVGTHGKFLHSCLDRMKEDGAKNVLEIDEFSRVIDSVLSKLSAWEVIFSHSYPPKEYVLLGIPKQIDDAISEMELVRDRFLAAKNDRINPIKVRGKAGVNASPSLETQQGGASHSASVPRGVAGNRYGMRFSAGSSEKSQGNSQQSSQPQQPLDEKLPPSRLIA